MDRCDQWDTCEQDKKTGICLNDYSHCSEYKRINLEYTQLGIGGMDEETMQGLSQVIENNLKKPKRVRPIGEIKKRLNNMFNQ